MDTELKGTLISLIPFFTKEAIAWISAYFAQKKAEEAMIATGATPEAIEAFKAFLSRNATLATKDVIDTLAKYPLPVDPPPAP